MLLSKNPVKTQKMATEGLLSFWWVCPQVASGWRGDRDQQVCAVVEWSGGRGEWFDSTNRRPIDGETACRHFVIDGRLWGLSVSPLGPAPQPLGPDLPRCTTLQSWLPFIIVFNWFYLGLLGFTGFYWVLLGFTGFYCVFTWFYSVLLGFTGFHLVLLGFT